MALVQLNFFSYILGMDSSINVLLPEKRNKRHIPNPDKKYPVLYLLHGHSDDQSAFIRKSNIEMLVRDHDLIVVMPNAHRGFYTNAKFGHNYYDYFVKELPVIVSNFFPASSKREDNYIAGISMGGYGAMKIALNNPQNYKAVGCLSAPLSPLETLDLFKEKPMFTVSNFEQNVLNIFGSNEEFEGSINDVYSVTKELEQKDIEKPIIYHTCGTEDVLYDFNIEYKSFIQNNTHTFDYTFEERKGEHNWEFWNKQLPVMLKKFGIVD